jgi:N-acetylgalactosamine-6-sulfatase
MRASRLLAAFVGLIGLFAQTDAEGQQAKAHPRPNIIVFLADDLGIADLGCYGAKDIRTPHIDRLARDGVRFTQFYSNGPECTPTRTALLTGRYQQRVGGLECAIGIGGVGRYDDAARLAGQHQLGLPASETTISKLLKDAGYATALFGKWHLGYEDHFTPNAHGFDVALYGQGGGMDYFHHVEDPPSYTPVLRLNGKPIQRKKYFTELVADEAVMWLQQQRNEKPFLLYVPFTAPHAPYQGPADDMATPLPADSTRWKQGSADPRVYAAMIESMDQAVGRILETLNRVNLSEQTIVVFTSDNGGTRSARPFPYRGFKGQTFEGGIRVPCIVRWPGVLKAGTESAHPAATFDLTASFAAAAGVKAPRPFDGIDILSHVANDTAPPARDLFWRQRRGDRTWKGVRSGASKYVSETVGDKITEQLFDLSRDSSENNDLLSQRPEEASRLRGVLERWETEVKPVR